MMFSEYKDFFYYDKERKGKEKPRKIFEKMSFEVFLSKILR